MTIAFETVEPAASEPHPRRHLAALPSTIDSFLEDDIVTSAHYPVIVDQMNAKFASILVESTIDR